MRLRVWPYCCGASILCDFWAELYEDHESFKKKFKRVMKRQKDNQYGVMYAMVNKTGQRKIVDWLKQEGFKKSITFNNPHHQNTTTIECYYLLTPQETEFRWW
jgi:hypothetical protein